MKWLCDKCKKTHREKTKICTSTTEYQKKYYSEEKLAKRRELSQSKSRIKSTHRSKVEDGSSFVDFHTKRLKDD